MTGNIDPLTTAHLRILREDHHAIRSAVENGFEDIRKRLNRVEQPVQRGHAQDAPGAGVAFFFKPCSTLMRDRLKRQPQQIERSCVSQ